MELWGGGGGVTDAGRAVFLSYASQDADAIQNLCKVLRAAGIEVWFDQSELRGGDAWDALIRKQIKGCYLFVPIISANTQSREEGYFRREWNLAVARTLDMVEDWAFLLPIVIDGISESEARVPEKFREVQWTRLPDGASLEAFVEHVRRLIAPEANAPKAPSSKPSPRLKHALDPQIEPRPHAGVLFEAGAIQTRRRLYSDTVTARRAAGARKRQQRFESRPLLTDKI
jgi:hypothetical protein